MKTELDAMHLNHIWIVNSLPPHKHTIRCKWVYKIKYKFDGSTERHKESLIAKGYTQQKGLDFLDTFSLVAKLVTVKILLALPTMNRWSFVQLDVNNTFCNGDFFKRSVYGITPWI